MKKRKSVFKSNKEEIIYNIINSGLAGGLVLLGSCATGSISKEGILVAVAASGIIALTKFKEYWDGEASEYSKKVFMFF